MRGHTWAIIGLLYCLVIGGLITAKLAGHIAWAWWIVLLPIWGPVALVVVLALVLIVGLGGAMNRGENPFQ